MYTLMHKSFIVPQFGQTVTEGLNCTTSDDCAPSYIVLIRDKSPKAILKTGTTVEEFSQFTEKEYRQFLVECWKMIDDYIDNENAEYDAKMKARMEARKKYHR